MQQIEFDDQAFFQAIEAQRKVENLSWRQVGRKLGLSPSTFSRLARGRRPDVDTFLRLLAWINAPTERFIKGLDQRSRDSDTLTTIASALKADPELPSEGAGALEQLVRAAYARLTVPQTPATPLRLKAARVTRRRR